MFNPLSKPGFLIRRLQQFSVQVFQRAMGEHDLTSMHYVALQVIQDSPGVDQISLSLATDIDRTTIVRILDRAKDRGWIEKRVDSDDRRVNRLYLTSSGEQLLEEVRDKADYSQELLMKPLEPEEREVFMNLLSKLVLSHASEGTATAILTQRSQVSRRAKADQARAKVAG